MAAGCFTHEWHKMKSGSQPSVRPHGSVRLVDLRLQLETLLPIKAGGGGEGKGLFFQDSLQSGSPALQHGAASLRQEPRRSEEPEPGSPSSAGCRSGKRATSPSSYLKDDGSAQVIGRLFRREPVWLALQLRGVGDLSLQAIDFLLASSIQDGRPPSASHCGAEEEVFPPADPAQTARLPDSAASLSCAAASLSPLPEADCVVETSVVGLSWLKA
ncbi:hypothetical protein EYF80_050264 [Liparis tanakae]|uniref:Uncharacterized protein n=1 Tax=Liparis tanakae TaxID=230148 RepID=A0A4Z2FFM4_9TELE|nr:hypothetical protein EYF80_050264 [Liparis tanakae]